MYRKCNEMSALKGFKVLYLVILNVSKIESVCSLEIICTNISNSHLLNKSSKIELLLTITFRNGLHSIKIHLTTPQTHIGCPVSADKLQSNDLILLSFLHLGKGGIFHCK